MVNKHNLKNSFRAIKSDIMKIEGDIMNIRTQQAEILVELEKLTATTKKPVKKKTSKKKK
ncbi:MAG: hypothetical protein PVJ67_01765 [Candidatus Pacearchaeota archaeon]|jgi:hypothetical protein